MRGRSHFWAPSKVQKGIPGGSPAAACTGTGTSGGAVQADKVPTATGSALRAGTAEEPDGVKASRMVLEQGKEAELSIQGGP